MDPFSRTALLLGSEGMQKLKNARVAVFGLGGVGGYVVEALARSGIGALELVDHDTISITNINRQILATTKTVGKSKVLAAKERVLEIDPDISVTAREQFFHPDTAGTFDFSGYSYVVDAIDTVTGKLALIAQAKAAGVPVISSMGTGNKLDATAFRVADISKTSGCALARIMRKECAKRGLRGIKVVYSEELPCTGEDSEELAAERAGSSRRSIPGSVSFVPGVAGLIMAGEVIKDLVSAKSE